MGCQCALGQKALAIRSGAGRIRLMCCLRRALFCLSILLLLALENASAQVPPPDTNTAWLAEHYTKYEYRIPMRDGVRLFTRVYNPKDDSKPWPILLTRTPYALKPYGDDNYTNGGGSFATLAKDMFIMVTQDVRGRYGSEGEYEHMRPFNPNKGTKDTDETSDAYDTIDWLVKNVPNNNGKVGMFGISYPGFYTSMGMIDSHPALKAASPQAPISDWFMGDDLHHNGAWFLSQNFGFFYNFAQKLEDPMHQPATPFNFKTPDGYDFFQAQYHEWLNKSHFKPALQRLVREARRETITLLHQSSDPQQNSATALHEFLIELEAHCSRDD